MKIIWTNRARADVKAIAEYIAEDNPRAASKWVAQMRATTQQLARFPFSGHEVINRDDEAFREIRHGNYRVFYQVAPNSVIITHVRHGARRAPWEPSGDEE